MGWIAGLPRCVDLIFLQETRLRPEAVPDAVAWALRSGWHSIFQPAVLSAAARPTGGTALLARPALALAKPPPARDAGGDGLVAHGCVRAAMGLLDVFAVYLPPGGATVRTEAALDRVAAALAGGAARSFLIGADWNAEPHDVQHLPQVLAMGGHVAAPPPSRPTCVTGRSESVIDFFVSNAIQPAAMVDLSVDCAAAIATHRPVTVVIDCHPAAQVGRAFRMAPKLPVQAPFGPTPAPMDWAPPLAAARAAADTAARAVAGGATHAQAMAALSAAYKHWANHFEKELALATDTPLERWGLRAAAPDPAAPCRPKSPKPVPVDVACLAGWRACSAFLEAASIALTGTEPGELPAFSHDVRRIVREQAVIGADLSPELGETIRSAVAVLHTAGQQLPVGDAADMIKDLLDTAHARRATIEHQVRERQAKAHGLWIDDAFERGAAGVHRWAKNAPAPPPVAEDDGPQPATPVEQLQADRALYAALWDDGPPPPHAKAAAQDIDELDADILVSAAATSPAVTATAPTRSTWRTSDSPREARWRRWP